VRGPSSNLCHVDFYFYCRVNGFTQVFYLSVTPGNLFYIRLEFKCFVFVFMYVKGSPF
jgi:hypothetical protein